MSKTGLKDTGPEPRTRARALLLCSPPFVLRLPTVRRLFGAFSILAATFFAYQFAVCGLRGKPDRAAQLEPFANLGHSYPFDISILLVGAWTLGVGLLFLLKSKSSAGPIPAHVPPTSLWAQSAAVGPRLPSPMAGLFLVNGLLLLTVLTVAYFGVRTGTQDHVRLVSVHSLVAGLQMAIGLLFLVLALFERPKGKAALLLGLLAWLAGTGVGVTVFMLGSASS